MKISGEIDVSQARRAMGLPEAGGTQKPVKAGAFIERLGNEVSEGAKIPNKFGAKKVKNEQGDFDSKHEARWAGELLILEQAGYISGLKVDKRELMFALDVNGVRICQYEADATFLVERDFPLSTLDGSKMIRAGETHILDAKSSPTRKRVAYVLKRNLMWAIHKIKILEV